MSFDFNQIAEGKRAYRIRLARRPLAEKLTLLDALRARTLALSGHRSKAATSGTVTPATLAAAPSRTPGGT